MERNLASSTEQRRTIVFTGATANFFKVGHATIHRFARLYPRVRLRLAIPDIEGARAACSGANVELVRWDPTRPESLGDVYEGCDATLLVPPIKNRVEVGRVQIAAAQRAGVSYVACLGVQHGGDLSQLGQDADVLEDALLNSGMSSCTMHLPMFLENLLYQRERIRADSYFTYPCAPDSLFSYVACSDLAEVVTEMLLNGSVLPDTYLSAHEQVSCKQLAESFTSALGRPISFRPCSADQFIDELVVDTGSASTVQAAKGVLELWERIDEGRDALPSGTLSALLRRPTQTAAEWIDDRRCCFLDTGCTHPQPPRKAPMMVASP